MYTSRKRKKKRTAMYLKGVRKREKEKTKGKFIVI